MYTATIELKLLSGLSSVCLTAAEKQRLNGLQNRYLQSILDLKPSYISRISNAKVLEQAGHTPATTVLLHGQLALYGKVLSAPENDHYVLRPSSRDELGL